MSEEIPSYNYESTPLDFSVPVVSQQEMADTVHDYFICRALSIYKAAIALNKAINNKVISGGSSDIAPDLTQLANAKDLALAKVREEIQAMLDGLNAV